MKEKLAKLQEDLTSMQASHQLAKSQHEGLKTQKIIAQQKLNNFEKELAAEKVALSTQVSAAEALKVKIAASNSAIGKAETDHQVASTNKAKLGAEIAGFDQQLASLNSSLNSDSSKLKQLEDSIGSIQRSIENHKTFISSYNGAIQRTHELIHKNENSKYEHRKVYQQSLAHYSTIKEENYYSTVQVTVKHRHEFLGINLHPTFSEGNERRFDQARFDSDKAKAGEQIHINRNYSNYLQDESRQLQGDIGTFEKRINDAQNNINQENQGIIRFSIEKSKILQNQQKTSESIKKVTAEKDAALIKLQQVEENVKTAFNTKADSLGEKAQLASELAKIQSTIATKEEIIRKLQIADETLSKELSQVTDQENAVAKNLAELEEQITAATLEQNQLQAAIDQEELSAQLAVTESVLNQNLQENYEHLAAGISIEEHNLSGLLGESTNVNNG